MKLLLAIPTMDTVPVQFLQSLTALERKLMTDGVWFEECIISGTLVYMARDKLAGKAVNEDFTHVLWLDSDMVFPPETLKYLLKEMNETGADLISGLYFRRCAPFSPVAFDTLEIKDGKATWTDYTGELSGLHEVGGVGFGCVLMKTDMLLDMAATYGDFFGPIANVGEDLAFCWRARQLGYKIMLDCNLKLGHVGHTVFTQQYFEALQGG